MRNDDIVEDGGRVRVPLMLMDAVQQQVVTSDKRPPQLGQKLSLSDYAAIAKDYGGPPNQVDPVPYDPSAARRAAGMNNVGAIKTTPAVMAAYEQMKARVSQAWRNPIVEPQPKMVAR